MKYFKIRNVTDSLGKREIRFNSDLDVEFITGFVKDSIVLKPNQQLYMKTKTLPITLHKMRLQGLISIVEVDSKEYELELLKRKLHYEKAVEDAKKMKKKEETKKTTKKTTATKPKGPGRPPKKKVDDEVEKNDATESIENEGGGETKEESTD